VCGDGALFVDDFGLRVDQQREGDGRNQYCSSQQKDVFEGALASVVQRYGLVSFCLVFSADFCLHNTSENSFR